CAPSLLLRLFRLVVTAVAGGDGGGSGPEQLVELTDQPEPSGEPRRSSDAVPHMALDLVLRESHVDRDVHRLVTHPGQLGRGPSRAHRGDPLTDPLEVRARDPYRARTIGALALPWYRCCGGTTAR